MRNINYDKIWLQTPEDLLENFIIKTDSYKVTHWTQLSNKKNRKVLKEVKKMISYFECRGCSSKKPDGTDLYSYSIPFGLQYVLLRHFVGQQITYKKLEQSKKFCKLHFGRDLVNEASWIEIIEKYDGYLPIIVRAVEEGTKIPLKNVLFTIENLDDSDISFWCADMITTWLTNYSETLFSHVWYPTTIITNSSHGMDTIKHFYKLTVGENHGLIPFSIHDFGGRGGTCYESSLIGDMSHLASGFMGTDTMQGIVLANKVYGEQGPMSGEVLDMNDKFAMYGFSVFATEHSTTTINGRHGERDFIVKCLEENMGNIVSMVGDSYSIRNFCKLLSEDKEIKALIIENGRRGGKFVLRPDSEDPTTITLLLMQMLEKGFGCTINAMGYKELPAYIGLLQGDGIDLQAIWKILQNFMDNGYAACNIIFGSGGGLIQKFDRDTLKIAIKAVWAIYTDGSTVNIVKDPEGEPNKKSKEGIPCLLKTPEGNYWTKDKCTMEEFLSETNQLKMIFRLGVLTKFISLNEVRANTIK